jgi:hypothetical protein
MRQFVACLLLFFTFTAFGQSSSPWPIYRNKACGYQIQYPPQAMLTSTDKENLYFPPLALLNDLKQNDPAFKNMQIIKHCTFTAALPIAPHTNLDHKYLWVVKIKNIPATWPPVLKQPGLQTKLITIGNKNFYQVTTSDAGMSHQYSYDYYFLKQKNNYVVVAFLLAAHSFGVKDSDKKVFDPNLEKQIYMPILTHFKLI